MDNEPVVPDDLVEQLDKLALKFVAEHITEPTAADLHYMRLAVMTAAHLVLSQVRPPARCN